MLGDVRELLFVGIVFIEIAFSVDRRGVVIVDVQASMKMICPENCLGG